MQYCRARVIIFATIVFAATIASDRAQALYQPGYPPAQPPNPSQTYAPQSGSTFAPSPAVPIPINIPLPQIPGALPKGTSPLQFVTQQLPPGGVGLTSIAAFPLVNPAAPSYGWWDEKTPAAVEAAQALPRKEVIAAAFADYLATVGILERAPIDPPVTLARGFIFRRGTRSYGALGPAYSVTSTVDLPKKSLGAWAIVLLDEAGRRLGRYGFTPRARDIVSFAFRVPEDPNTAAMELIGPSGVADKKVLSGGPPRVRIIWPQDGGIVRGMTGVVRVSWQAEAESGKRVLASVFYSADGGRHYKAEAFEQQLTSLDVRLKSQATDHTIKVLVTDGTRSGQAVASFSVGS